MRHCQICGEEFPTWLDACDHGHDGHGLFHFQDPTIEGPRPRGMPYPFTYEQQDDRTQLWAAEDWKQV